MSKYMQGLFKPNNPKKYKGDVKNIVYRSAWEMKYMIQLDSDPTVVEWASEEFCIPYTDKATGKFHRYFPDFKVVKKMPDGKLQTFIIEIKPESQTIAPKKKTKPNRKFLKEVMTYGKNLGKWESAERYCKSNGFIFQILTEKQLRVF